MVLGCNIRRYPQEFVLPSGASSSHWSGDDAMMRQQAKRPQLRLRIEDAKRRLERTEASVDEISWRVGYEEPAFFRRLFKRVTGLAPGAYRQRFRMPDYARPGSGH